ncbi:MAG: hypothetical protein OXE03_10210 [Gammaproteobacteria bacterium]|nr:hypothetical protein [Gammaproteobacteria bacterium]
MKPEHEFLRNAAFLFAGSAMLSAALLTGSGLFERRMERACQHHRAQLHETRQRYLTAVAAAHSIRDYLPQFSALQDTGLWGKEHRLNWIETLQDAAAALQLPALSYEIGARQVRDPGMGLPSGSHRVYSSAMTLDMQLLHEGDLFALLDLLEARAKGLYRVASCELTRNFEELTDHPSAANLRANCLLEWYSIGPADDLEINTD